MDWASVLQLVSTVFAALGAFGAYRARDNSRAAEIKEIQTDVKYILKRLDVLEGRVYVRKVKKEESA